MEKITAIIMSLLTTLSLFFGMAGSPDYKKGTGLKEALDAVINKGAILSTEFKGDVSEETWNENSEYKLEDTVVLTKEKDKDFVILNIT